MPVSPDAVAPKTVQLGTTIGKSGKNGEFGFLNGTRLGMLPTTLVAMAVAWPATPRTPSETAMATKRASAQKAGKMKPKSTWVKTSAVDVKELEMMAGT